MLCQGHDGALLLGTRARDGREGEHLSHGGVQVAQPAKALLPRRDALGRQVGALGLGRRRTPLNYAPGRLRPIPSTVTRW
jgi:hypothetical protein